MNYRHAYHAGNFADVLKHVVLMLCLERLQRKDTPLRVIDTHAGAGRYQLDTNEAEKTGEWRDGIGRLLGASATAMPADVTAVLAPYLAAIKAENTAQAAGADLRTYVGSPLLIQAALRAGDAFIANELHPDDALALKSALGGDRLCKITTHDGYAALKALLPPKERRGLVLIDPPFELPGEFIRMTDALGEALKRFATGVYLLWYPIKDEKPVARFHRGVLEATQAAGVAAPLVVELLRRPARNPLILNGAGLIIINPPYQLVEALAVVLPYLAEQFGDHGKGAYALTTLPRDSQPRAPLHGRPAEKPSQKAGKPTPSR